MVGDNWLVTIGWWQVVGDNWLVASGRREEEGGADTTLKTKTPHVNVNVGNNIPYRKTIPARLSA